MSQAVDYKTFTLPSSVVTKTDISKLMSDLERFDGEMTAVAVKEKIEADPGGRPVMSDLLEGFLSQNNLSVDDSVGRSDLIRQLRRLKDSAPVVHMTFAVEADRSSLQDVVSWLRESVHPQAVISIGLQPSLVAGVYMRTTNKVHDMSLRSILRGSRESLVKELEALRGRS